MKMFINFMLALLLVPLANSCDPTDCKIGTAAGAGTCAVGTAVGAAAGAATCAAGALFTFGLSCIAGAAIFAGVGAGCAVAGTAGGAACDLCTSDDAPDFQGISNKLDGIEQTQLENHLKQKAWFQQLEENDKNIIRKQGEIIALQQKTVGQLDELISSTETLGNKIDHSEIVSLYGQDFIHVRNVRSKFKLLSRGTSGVIVNDRRAEVFQEAVLNPVFGSEASINNILLMLIGGHPLKKESIYETFGDKYCKPEVHKYFVDVLVESLTMHSIALQMKGKTLSPQLSNKFNLDVVKATSAYNRHCDCLPELKKANRGQVSTLLDRLPSSSHNLIQNRGRVARMENSVMRIKMDLLFAVKNFEPNQFAETILESHSVEDIELVVASVMNKKEDLEHHDSADICVDKERNKVICPYKDDMNSVIFENHWRTYNEIAELSEDEKRNILLIGVGDLTGHTIGDLQARSNEGESGSLTAIANMATLLSRYFIRASSDVKTLTYDDLRNILIIETSKRDSIQLPLQGMTDHQLLKRFCTVKTTAAFTPDSFVYGCFPPQTLEHGRFLCLDDGVTCHVVCDKGYEQTYSRTFMECLDNAWNPLPKSFKCEVICPYKDDMNSVILENHWRTYNEIAELSEDAKRNLLISGVREMTGHTTEDLQGRANDGESGSLTAIANMAALLPKYFIRASSDVKTLIHVELRNILIIETSKRDSIKLPLQGMTDHQLLKRFCTACTGYESLGCWKDATDRAIKTLEGSDSRLTGNYWERKNALEVCFEVAKSKGYPAFAVEHGGWCAASLSALETYQKYGAAHNCADGKGGAWSLDVYKIIEGGRCGPTDAEPHVRREGRRHASTGHVPTCSGGATLLSTSPRLDMVLCKDKNQSTCQKDFETLCPAGWNLCTPGQYNNRNHGWDYNWEDANAGQPIGAIYCRGGAGAALHIYSSNPVLNRDQRLNCGVSSSRPGCEAFAGTSDCTAKDKSALCCAPTRSCGDGVVQQEEDCDDGNNSNMDDCLNTCTWKYPGKHGLSGC